MEKLIENPENEEAISLLEEYLPRDFTVIMSGLCLVNYQGRAKSKLDKGERILIKKQDSAFLVHGPDNYQPKNWQPEADRFEVTEEKQNIVVKAFRNNPEEVVEVNIESIDFISVQKLVDKSDLVVKGHEIDIHEAIEKEPEIVEENLKIVEREYETPAGFIDVFARDSDENYVVIEVKRNPDYNTVLQLQRYVDEIEDEYAGDIRGILVAPKMTDNVLDYLNERDLEFVEVSMDQVISDYDSFDDSQSDLGDF